MNQGVTEYFDAVKENLKEKEHAKKDKAISKITKGYQYPGQTPVIGSDLGSGRDANKGIFKTGGLPFVTEGLVSSVTAFA